MEEFTISPGNIHDLEILTRHRILMWTEIYPELADSIAASEETTRDWIKVKLLQGSMIPFMARTADGKVAGSGCILIKEDQPRPTDKSVYTPYLMSMYTESECRKKGVATGIVAASIKWCREHGYGSITLHASKEGRGIYEGFGFNPTNEMRLSIR